MKSDIQLQQLENVFRLFFRKITAEWNRLIDSGLSSSQAHILDILQCNGPQKVSDLAEALDITLSGVTGLSDRLLTAGFAKRERSEQDRRIVFLEITPAGTLILEKVGIHRKSIIQKYYGNLPEEDIEHLIRIYRMILHPHLKAGE
jgi:DNA-binding MarR family transcriptional regulator